MVDKKKAKKKTSSSNKAEPQTSNLVPEDIKEQKALENIFVILLKSSRVDFSHYRHTTILRRMSRRMSICKQDSYLAYLAYLKTHPAEVENLYDDLLLSFTHFFRDPHIFDTLKEKVFPALINDRPDKTPVRIWVPGCSTGEEVYSLAICLYEFIEKNKSKLSVQFYGTDLVERHIKKARLGIYSDQAVKDISDKRLDQFFENTSEGYKIARHIREMCVFAVQNITQDPPFSNIDLVSCRNVLIYFDAAFQETVIPLFHFAINSSGFLLLGTSETVGKFSQFFNTLDQKINLYSKRILANKPVYKFPTQQAPSKLKDSTGSVSVISNCRADIKEVTKKINEILLETYAPPGVLIDSRMHIHQFVGQIFTYLGPISGEASLKLSKMIGEGLMPDLYVAIEEVKRKKKRVRKKNISFKQNNKTITIDLCVIPVSDSISRETNFLVLFEKSDKANISKISSIHKNQNPDYEVSALKQELQLTKEQLQSIIEEKEDVNQELWASNEEVQSTNEEMQSVNEELETAKEELESTNEELLTLNEELKIKNSSIIEAKEFVENLLETARVVILTLDINACITTFNGYAEKLTGYKREEVLGKNWFDIAIPEKNRANLFEAFSNVLKNMPEVAKHEDFIVTKKGEKKMISWSNNVLRDTSGNISGILSIGMDITDSRKTENELRKRELKYRLLVENANSAIIRWNRKGHLTYFNEFSEKLFGYKREEILNKHIIGTIVPAMESTGRDLRSLMDDISINPQNYEYNVNENMRKDGNHIWVAWTNKVYINEISGEVEVLSIGSDISMQKKAEKEKEQAQQYAANQEKHALVGQVAGKIAHDFNNILGVIMGNVELSLMECKDSELKDTLDLIFDQTMQGRNLTKNLVAFAKSQELKQEFFKINKKVDLVLNLLKKDLQGVKLTREYEDDVPSLLADPGMIEHALINLVQNSIHATSTVEHPEIRVSTYSIDQNIYFKIMDNGCGIPKEHIKNIFKPSFTLKGSYDVSDSYGNDIKGTGYGMSNVKKYIEQHKGIISVESEFGSGTIITISIPVIKKDLTNEEKEEIGKSKIETNKYVLLVEDEAAIADIQYRILTRGPCNHKVDIAHNGRTAIDLFKANNYDFVSLDYVLPGDINGRDIYDNIRKTDKTIPILFISGNIEFIESIRELKKKDVNVDHLSKPCQNKDYLDNVNKLLKRVRIS